MRELKALLTEYLQRLGPPVYEETDAPPGAVKKPGTDGKPGTGRELCTYTLQGGDDGRVWLRVAWHGEGDAMAAACWLTKLRLLFPGRGVLLMDQMSCLARPAGWKCLRDEANPRLRTAFLTVELIPLKEGGEGGETAE